MDLVKAIQKISKCIDTATTKEHHEAIEQMINNVENFCKHRVWWDKTVKGALALLFWQNVYQYEKKFGSLK